MAHSSTAWSQQRPKGSDKISNPKGNNNSKEQAKQRSPEVKRLHKLITNLQDPKSVANETDEGCFCLAQVHPLSPYVPICSYGCGLTLCELNQPYRNCPFKSCGQPLLSPQARTELITSLSNKIEQTIAEEEEKRRREAEAQKKAEGAFPQLGAGHPNQAKVPLPTTHKVLSLTSKGAVLKTVRTSTPPPAQAAKQDTTPAVHRVRPPPPEPAHFATNKVTGAWESLRAERFIYVPPTKAQQQHSYGKKRLKKEQQKKEDQSGE